MAHSFPTRRSADLEWARQDAHLHLCIATLLNRYFANQIIEGELPEFPYPKVLAIFMSNWMYTICLLSHPAGEVCCPGFGLVAKFVNSSRYYQLSFLLICAPIRGNSAFCRR